MTDHVYSWVATPDERREREQHARRAIGLRLAGVRYLDIDYQRGLSAPDHEGLREVTDPADWADPPWRGRGFDAVDFGVELTFEGGRTFTVTWDPPGDVEGIGIREVPAVGTAVTADADAASWDVGRRSGWADYLGKPVIDVVPHYLPWTDRLTGFWCPRITLQFGDGEVDLLLGESDGDELAPSADTVAVIFSPDPLPEWEQSSTAQT